MESFAKHIEKGIVLSPLKIGIKQNVTLLPVQQCGVVRGALLRRLLLNQHLISRIAGLGRANHLFAFYIKVSSASTILVSLAAAAQLIVFAAEVAVQQDFLILRMVPLTRIYRGDLILAFVSITFAALVLIISLKDVIVLLTPPVIIIDACWRIRGRLWQARISGARAVRLKPIFTPR